MRAIWSGTISFGLVNIPVKLYSAVDVKDFDLDLLHKKDMSPVRYARICRADGKEIPYDEIVKGYEFQEDDYIILTDEDFKKANVKMAKTVEIIDFVKEEEVDSIFFEKPYYLEPQKGSEKSYSLLRDALKKSGKVGVGKFVIRNREHLGIIKPEDNVVVLNQLRFFDEIRETKDLNLPEVLVSEKEVEMALSLIDQLTETFHPEKYKDTYINELKRIIEEKAKGKTPEAKGEEPKPTNIKDLLDTLKQSIEQEKLHQRPVA